MDNKSINTVENFANCGLDKDAEYLLLIELDGTITSLKEQKEEVLNLLNIANAKNFIIDDSIAEKVWEARCSSFAAVTRLAPDVVSDDIIVSRDKLVELIKICNEISNKYNLNMCLIGHIGDGNLHPQIALDLDDEDQFKNYIDAKSELYSSVISLGGMISGEHGVGIEKLPYFEKIMDSEVLNYMKLIKRSFDPKNIMNPGKMFSI